MEKQSLLEVAKESARERRERIADEEFALTLGYLNGEISSGDVAKALKLKNVGTVWHRLFQYMVSAYRKGWLVVAKPEGRE